MSTLAALFGISSGLGYLLPAIIGLESMGVPSPGETALVLAAVLASQGKLQIWLVLVIGISSAIIGDNAGYLLGRRFGREVLAGKGPFYARRRRLIVAGDRFFEKHGPKAVFFARWIALVRFVAAWLAGINGMRFRDFFFWNALGGITWGLTFGLVGYFAGSAAANAISSFGVYAAIGLVLLAVAGFVYLKIHERRARERLADDGDSERDSDE
jgi:membrane protein DedA with SNARE-associated domain